MRPLLYIIVFIQIIVKGCMESTRTKAALLTLLIVAGSTFGLHFFGLLLMAWFGLSGVAWPMGAVSLLVIALAYIVVALIYLGIRDAILNKRG